jgi:hypothetical protein
VLDETDDARLETERVSHRVAATMLSVRTHFFNGLNALLRGHGRR